MLDVLSPLILWPIGVALGGLLFFEIAKHCWRVDPVPRAFEARKLERGRRPVALRLCEQDRAAILIEQRERKCDADGRQGAGLLAGRIALSCWLFFEITKLGLEQSVVPRRVVASSISSKHGALSDARRP